jgi:hypothetical protein
MTTWSTIRKPSWFTLLTPLDVINTGGGSASGVLPGKVLSTDVGAVGQFFEITVTQESALGGSSTNCSAIGLANAATDLNIDFDGTTGVGLHSDGYFVAAGGSVIYTGVTWDDTDVIGVEWHGLADVRFYKNGTLGYTYTGALPDGDLYAAVYLLKNPNEVVANFGATAWAHDPGGVTGWSGGASGPASAVVAQTLPAIIQLTEFVPGAGGAPPPAFGTGGFFPDTIAEILAGREVRCDFLVFFDFATTPMRLWQGFGTLLTLDANEWQGIGQLGRISDLESSIGGTSPSASFTLSGVDSGLVADSLSAENEIFGQNVDVFIQYFNSSWACLDEPYAVWSGIMDKVRIKQGPDSCEIEVSAETIFARRALPPLGNLTHLEQQMFFPGDRGLSYIPQLLSKVAIFPVIQPIS